MSVSGHPVGGRVRATDVGRVIIIPREAAIRGTVFGVWIGDGVGVSVSPPTDAAWKFSMREAALEDHGPRQRATNLQYFFPNRGGGE